MLIEFRFQNHRSIKDEQVLTMETSQGRDPGDPRPRALPGYSGEILPAAALYGANASGKSNVLSALGFMRDAVVDSHQAWPPEGGTPRDAFAWGVGPSEPSLFELVFLLGGVRYQYGFVLTQQVVVEEWLNAWPKGRRQMWFEREEGRFQFGDSLRGENRVVEQVTRSNSLFLSTAAQHQHEQLLPLQRWFRRLRTVRVEGYRERFADAMPAASAAAMFAALAAASAASTGPDGGLVRLGELLPQRGPISEAIELLSTLDASGTTRLGDLLRAADLGISEFRIDPKSGGDRKGRPPEVSMLHRTRSGDGWLALERESAGTRALFELGPLVVDALERGTVLVIDELEASLHPLLALQVVRLFNSPETNPRNAQLLFSTHDTNLLGSTLGAAALRRDQVWLTEKDNDGSTQLYPLTDFKPRKAENLERGYLQGRYGAIPYLGPLARMAEEPDGQ